MHPRSTRTRSSSTPSVKAVSTLSLVNEAYSRLRASAAAYSNACRIEELCAIKAWMESFGDRLEGMAEKLQDEGARQRRALDATAARLYDTDVCSSPEKMLREAIINQRAIVNAFALITERLDMDADLYELVTDQHEEMSEALIDMQELLREYETYGQVA